MALFAIFPCVRNCCTLFVSRFVCQVLSYSFVNVNAIERAEKRQKLEKLPTWLVWLIRKMETWLHSRGWRRTVTAVVLAGECNGTIGGGGVEKRGY